MNKWKPISEIEFKELFDGQFAELDEREKRIFNRFRVAFWRATIHRSDMAGDEFVYVVAQNNDGVLYFDDVEYGFNISTIDNNGKILSPGGGQASLKEAICDWFPEL